MLISIHESNEKAFYDLAEQIMHHENRFFSTDELVFHALTIAAKCYCPECHDLLPPKDCSCQQQLSAEEVAAKQAAKAKDDLPF